MHRVDLLELGAGSLRSVSGPPAGDVVDSAGGEGEIGREEERDQCRDFRRLADAAHRDAAGHIADMLFADLRQDLRLDYRRRDGIDEDAFSGDLFGERLGRDR